MQLICAVLISLHRSVKSKPIRTTLTETFLKMHFNPDSNQQHKELKQLQVTNMMATSFQFQRTWFRGMVHQKYVITAPNSKPFFMAEMRTGCPSLTNTSLHWHFSCCCWCCCCCFCCSYCCWWCCCCTLVIINYASGTILAKERAILACLAAQSSSPSSSVSLGWWWSPELWAISSQLGLFSLLFGSQLSCANNKLQNKTLRTGSITFNKSDGETADLWLDCMGAQWQIK